MGGGVGKGGFKESVIRKFIISPRWMGKTPINQNWIICRFFGYPFLMYFN